MRLQISLSAQHNFIKGDRVVCKIAKNEWYIGTVVRAGAKVKVDFDDDFDAIIDENDFKHIKLLVKDKKLKRSLTDIEAKALYEQKKTLKQAVTPTPKKIPIPLKKPNVVPAKPTKVSLPIAKPIKQPTVRPIDPVIPTVPRIPVKRFTPDEPRTPIHAPTAPTAVPELHSGWQVFIMVNDYRQWAYQVKDRPLGAKKFKASRFEFLNAANALRAALKEVPVPVLTIHVTAEANGRPVVTKDVSHEGAMDALIKVVGDAVHISEPTGPATETTGDGASAPYLKCGNDSMFEKAAKGSDNDKLSYMQYVWGRGQVLIFHTLIRPNIRFLKEQKTKSFRRRGHWHAKLRELAMSRRVFNAGEVKFLEVFLHEMCHQAVTDVDKAIDPNGGHGPRWTAWMQKCGIPASRYDYTAATEYMDDDEKFAHQKTMELRENAMKTGATRIMSNRSIEPGTPAKFYSTRENKWVYGVVAGIFGTKMLFGHSLSPKTDGWLTLPNQGKDWLHELSSEEFKQYSTIEWRALATYIQTQARARQDARRNKRAAGTVGDDLDSIMRRLRSF